MQRAAVVAARIIATVSAAQARAIAAEITRLAQGLDDPRTVN